MNKIFVLLCTLALLTVIVAFIFMKNQIAPKSIVFKHFDMDLRCLNSTVKYVGIAHSRIPFPLIRKFTTGRFSHWAVLVWDIHNNMYLASTSFLCALLIHHIDPNSVKAHYDRHIQFKDADGWNFVIGEDEVFQAKHNITLMDVVRECYKLVKSKSYNPFTTNCQYQTTFAINNLTDSSVEINDKRPSGLIKSIANEIFADHITKFDSSKQK